jgi:hypothetical protein
VQALFVLDYYKQWDALTKDEKGSDAQEFLLGWRRVGSKTLLDEGRE